MAKMVNNSIVCQVSAFNHDFFSKFSLAGLMLCMLFLMFCTGQCCYLNKTREEICVQNKNT